MNEQRSTCHHHCSSLLNLVRFALLTLSTVLILWKALRSVRTLKDWLEIERQTFWQMDDTNFWSPWKSWKEKFEPHRVTAWWQTFLHDANDIVTEDMNNNNDSKQTQKCCKTNRQEPEKTRGHFVVGDFQFALWWIKMIVLRKEISIDTLAASRLPILDLLNIELTTLRRMLLVIGHENTPPIRSDSCSWKHEIMAYKLSHAVKSVLKHLVSCRRPRSCLLS